MYRKKLGINGDSNVQFGTWIRNVKEHEYGVSIT